MFGFGKNKKTENDGENKTGFFARLKNGLSRTRSNFTKSLTNLVLGRKTIDDELLEEIVRTITSRRKVWVDTMMKEELGLIEDKKSPVDSSVSTFLGFNLIGVIPLIPFIVFFMIDSKLDSFAFVYSTISVMVAFFLVGIIKGQIVKKSKIRSGVYTLIIGGIAAIVAYSVGYGLNFLVT